MKIKTNKPVTNLDEAVSILIGGLDEADLTELKKPDFEIGMCHFTVGMALRNEWKLWEQKTPLVKWFKKTYGLDHADDISGIVLDSMVRDVRGEPRQDKKLAKKYLKHWEKYGK